MTPTPIEVALAGVGAAMAVIGAVMAVIAAVTEEIEAATVIGVDKIEETDADKGTPSSVAEMTDRMTITGRLPTKIKATSIGRCKVNVDVKEKPSSDGIEPPDAPRRNFKEKSL